MPLYSCGYMRCFLAVLATFTVCGHHGTEAAKLWPRPQSQARYDSHISHTDPTLQTAETSQNVTKVCYADLQHKRSAAKPQAFQVPHQSVHKQHLGEGVRQASLDHKILVRIVTWLNFVAGMQP